MTPKRIQRKRTKGWRLPPNTVCVDRTSRYGNPFVIVPDDSGERDGWWVQDSRDPIRAGWFRPTMAGARELAVSEYRAISPALITLADLERLRGKDVACFCDPSDGMACHGDVLIEAANR